MKNFINKYVDSIFSIGMEKTQKLMSDAKKEFLPKFLFKFYPPTINSMVNLQNQQLYLSSPKNFNDPFDSYFCVEDQTFIKLYILEKLKQNKLLSKENTPTSISKDEYWEIFHSWSNDQENYRRISDFSSSLYQILEKKSESLCDVVRAFRAEARNEFKEKIKQIRELSCRITCFSNFKDESELEKNTTMWSHYSDNHQGFCVKYSLCISDSKYSDAILCGLFPVNYTSKIPKISTRELLKLKYSGDELLINKPILKTIMKTLITKAIFWSYEKEWRLIFTSENIENLIDGNVPFPHIESIYMGFKIKLGLKIALIKFAEMNNIQIFESKQHSEKYKLIFTPVNSISVKESIFYDKLHEYNKIEDSKKRLEKVSKLSKEFGM